MKLSIITINYNHLEGLKKTFQSVKEQIWCDYEWIVIDGGSTDGSKEFIVEHQDCFAYWCSEPDGGVYNAMNKGIVRAQGEYVNFMNSGDTFFDSTSLKRVFAQPRFSDILYGAMLLPNGELDHSPMMKSDLQWFDFYEHTLPHQASFIRRDLFDRIGLYDESYRIAADWYFFAKAFVWYKVSSDFIPALLARFEGGGLSSNGDQAEVENQRFKKEVFGTYLLAVRDRTMYFDVIHEYHILAILHSILYRIARYWHNRKHENVKIEGFLGKNS